MSKLIEQLRAEHAELEKLFDTAHQKGITSPEGGEALKLARQKLADHLAKEDSRLYPILQAAAKKTENIFGLEGIINSLSAEMISMSAALNEFSEKFMRDPGRPELDGEFRRISKMLSGRIRKEEDTVFRFYEKLVD